MRPRRSRLPQAQDLLGRAGRRRESGAAQAVSRIRAHATSARCESSGADGSFLSRSFAAGSEDRECQGGDAEKASLVPRQAAPLVPARIARVAARRRRRRTRDARCGAGHRGCADALGAALILVDGGRIAGEHRRKRGGERFRRQAAVRPHRSADPALRGRVGQGRRPDAPRGALLRRDQRTGRSTGAGGTARVPTARPDSERRRTVRRCRARAAASARGARSSGHREGPVAQTDRRPRRELAQAQADALRAARQDRGDRRAFAVEALCGARGSAGQAAKRTGFRSGRHGIRDRTAARRIGNRELCDRLAGAASAGRRDDRASRYDPARGRRRGAIARRDGAPCAGAFAARPGCARNSGEPAAYGAGARRVLQGPRQTRRSGDARPRQQADHGRAEDAWPRARRAAADVVPAADRPIRAAGRAGRRRRPRTAR